MLHPEKLVVVCVSRLGLQLRWNESAFGITRYCGRVVCPARLPGIKLKHLIIPLKWTNTHRHRPDDDLAIASTLLLLSVMEWLVDLYHLKAGAAVGL